MNDISQLLNGPLPPDVTLGQIRRAFDQSIIYDETRDAIEQSVGRYTSGIVVRFVYVSDLADCPDDMELGTFRQLANAGTAKIIIEEGDGGAPAKKPEYV